MTITDVHSRTLDHAATTTLPQAWATHPVDARTPAGALLDTLEAALTEVADADPAAIDSRLPEGRDMLDLARRARAAVAVLGGDPGTDVTSAPGVVVVRELVAATRLLRSAVAQTTLR